MLAIRRRSRAFRAITRSIIGFFVLAAAASKLAAGGGAPAELVLLADFNTVPLGPIGMGGPTLGEPSDYSNLEASVVASPELFGTGHRSLSLVRAGELVSAPIDFQFIDQREINTGYVVISLRLLSMPSDNTGFSIYPRQRESSAYRFADLHFASGGEILFSSEAQEQIQVGSFVLGQAVDLQIQLDFDHLTSTVLADGVVIVDEAPIAELSDQTLGRLIFSQPHTSVGTVYVDDILVEHFLGDEWIFTGDFDSAAVSSEP